jgi:hypothetical protein
MSELIKSSIKRLGVSGVNKPKRTPSHPTKSHVVLAKEGSKVKTIRFGQQGVSGSPKKEGESSSERKRRESFKARHAKNISKGKMSAAHWSNITKWATLPLTPDLLNGSFYEWENYCKFLITLKGLAQGLLSMADWNMLLKFHV